MTKMTITLEKQSSFARLKADAIIIPWVQGDKAAPIALPNDAKKIIAAILASKEFSGRHMETAVVRVARPRLQTYILVGLGKKEDRTLFQIAQVVGAGVMRAKKMHASSVAVIIPDSMMSDIAPGRTIETMALGIRNATYVFTKYKTKKSEETRTIARCAIMLSHAPTREERDALRRASVLADSIDLAKNIGNADSVEVTPETLAETARSLGKEFSSITVRTLAKKELEKEKCGGILAVGKGSQHEPRLIALEYRSTSSRQARPVVLVGKAITFDTGGISIKPWKQMDEMKYDMCGGAAVLGVMRAIAATKLPVHVVGLIAAAENMPSHTAFKPGDVVRMADGTTVEVISTDAEGRMVLADAMVYARRYKPATMIDLATLTGAVIAALGDYASGLFTDNETLAEHLIRIGNETGDRVWRLPLVKEWKKMMKSTFADLKNASDGKIGGATMGGLFLQHFVEKKTAWAHLDIAGTAWNMTAMPWMEAGATGAGIPLVVEYLHNRDRIGPRQGMPSA